MYTSRHYTRCGVHQDKSTYDNNVKLPRTVPRETNQVRLLDNNSFKDLRQDHSIRHAVMATWWISFTQIQKTEQSAADLLSLMSMFDRQGIPISLPRNSTSQLDFDNALTPLLNFSLVRPEIGMQSFEMHRLVQLSTRRWLETDRQLHEWIKKSIRVLATAFPSAYYDTWEECHVLLPHAREAINHRPGDDEDALNQSEIALNLGNYLDLRGEYKAAENIFRLSVTVREKALGREHPDMLWAIS